ncbi:MAG: transketolase [Candidatus Wallbacteria bacterium HGW-Wallbacteria-1]|jgi:transketolase|uniref:Transketolase n=1 Tax=Candidatus Wallbacteria bacterium HGW-Wallbacteria-1 TaxID=2013854 RepID=A0A2N1PP35_9BACT|nr:MAG: transketolase [Candidatus Wallbacteria bacterium HGW-Wallbacteria-1]
MRDAFFSEIKELAARNNNLYFLTGDLGFGCSREFSEAFPDRFINVGVAEQLMTSMAAGMALEGNIVFTYSIANFPTIKCVEQIRNDICYHNANVKIVAVGGGTCYGSLGMSHFATEDIAIMRAIPNLIVLAPGDPQEARLAIRAAVEHDGPVYLRLGRAGEPIVHKDSIDFAIGKGILLRSGADVCLASTGGMLKTALDAADILESIGISARVLSIPSIKPMDSDFISANFIDTPLMVTIEEHSIVGGFGSAVLESLSLSSTLNRGKLIRFGFPDSFPEIVGSQEYILKYTGLDARSVADRVKDLL